MIELFRAPADLPFIGIKHVIEYDKDGHLKPPLISIAVIDEIDCIPNATSDTLIDMFSVLPVLDHPNVDPEYMTREQVGMFTINVAANEIAKKSRRGTGNILIGSAAALSSIPTNMFLERTDARMFECNDFPDDEILLVYKGTGAIFKAVDAPFAYDGKTLRVLPNWSQYCARISLV